jgi:hypothetical protein
MSRFPRLRRRPDQWSDVHQRAATLLAERMDGPVGLTESTWLDEHLASCPACAAIAAAYEDERLALRALRDDPPQPPRDLWARTAAGIEAAGSGGRRSIEGNVRRSLPLGAMTGVVVVVLVVGVSLLSGGIPIYLGSNGVTGEGSGEGPSPASAMPGSAAVAPTPIAVDGAGDVGWIESGPDGATTHRVAVEKVCPTKGEADCPTLRDADQRLFALQGARAIVGSPTREQAVAISDTAGAGDEVVVVAMPETTDTPAPSVEPSPSTTPAPSSEPSVAASSAPPASAPVESAPVASASSEPPIASIDPTTSPEPTVAATLAIASDVEVVGESAAFSADGTWFAFTARAADGSGGPDVYAWHVGDELARRLTDDGASYFGSWSGNELIASRPDDPASDEAEPKTIRIDPATGAETDAGAGWRPAVDPTGKLAIVWDGTLDRTADAAWTPGTGALELRSWSDSGPGGASGSQRTRVVTDAAPQDFDVRWDETGEWVAVWIADPDDLVIGRLTLYHVDTERERLEVVDGAPADVPALPGFSIGDGRLAWATPRGQGGEGSRIQIAAWSSTDVGIVESSPGEDPIVIR